jgi:hypothetical protein
MAATVYRWVDSNGVVHYSDQPHQGAKKADLGTLQVIQFHAPATETPLPETNARKSEAPHYKVAILAPADGTTLRPGNQQVHVRVKVAPALGPTAKLQYKFDGKPLGEPTTALRALLKKVYRGSHTLEVSVLSPQGKSLESASSTFYVHQHSRLFNKHKHPGPGSHPAPRPQPRSGGPGGGHD